MRDGSTVLSSGRARVTTSLVGARPHPAIRAESQLPGVVNSYVGNDRRRWRTGLPTYGAVRYAGVYPGVDLRYHGAQGQLEYDFLVRPGTDPGRIGMSLSGGTPRLTGEGDLVIPTKSGRLHQRRPVAYQLIGDRRVPVDAAFELRGRHVGFRLGGYDKRNPLVIDPQLLFSTYI